jgi:Fe(3+) dicitrate transport protein
MKIYGEKLQVVTNYPIYLNINLTLGISLEHQKYELNFNGRFNGKFRTQAGIGSTSTR